MLSNLRLVALSMPSSPWLQRRTCAAVTAAAVCGARLGPTRHIPARERLVSLVVVVAEVPCGQEWWW